MQAIHDRRQQKTGRVYVVAYTWSALVWKFWNVAIQIKHSNAKWSRSNYEVTKNETSDKSDI